MDRIDDGGQGVGRFGPGGDGLRQEADFHDFFKHADGLDAPVLVRASRDRTVNRRTRCAEKGVSKLWDHMGGQPAAGTCLVGVPGRAKTKRCAERTARTAVVNVSFARYTMNPPRDNAGTAPKSCPTFNLTRFFFGRKGPRPTGMNPRTAAPYELAGLILRGGAKNSPLAWSAVADRDVLQDHGVRLPRGGMQAEQRRPPDPLPHRHKRGRLEAVHAHADSPRRTGFALHGISGGAGRKALRAKVLGTARGPDTAPTVAEAGTLIARLGGYPARKCDGPPGTLALWRGWRRLADLAEGWRLAQS